MNNNTITTLTVIFPDCPLVFKDIRFFRSYVNDVLEWQNPCFHNLNQDGESTNTYPVIQYRSNKGSASLLAVNGGIIELTNLLCDNPKALPEELQKFTLVKNEVEVTQIEKLQLYIIGFYVPFRLDEYKLWKKELGLRRRLEILESTIAQDLRFVLSGLGLNLEILDSVKIMIELIEENNKVVVPQQFDEFTTWSLSISFWSNVQLPKGISIGLGTEYGFGIVRI